MGLDTHLLVLIKIIMKKLLFLSVLMFAFVFSAGLAFAEEDTISDLSESSIGTIVDKVLELNYEDKTRDEIVEAILGMVEVDDDDEMSETGPMMSTNKGRSSIAHINYGQFKKTFRVGNKGAGVTELQEALNAVAEDLGLVFIPLTVDGHFGSKTSQLVKTIQAYKKLAIDGIVGPQTHAQLLALLSDVDDGDENTAPVITLVGDAEVTLAVDADYAEEGATAEDAEDGNITTDIVTDSSAVDTSITGEYEVTYDVADSDGLAADQVIRKVTVE